MFLVRNDIWNMKFYLMPNRSLNLFAEGYMVGLLQVS